MVAHSLARFAKNVVNDMYWLEDEPPLAIDTLYHDCLHINEWVNHFILKKKNIYIYIYIYILLILNFYANQNLENVV